jgi:hypothetical protein
MTNDFKAGVAVGENLRKFRLRPACCGQLPFLENFANDAWLKAGDQWQFLKGVEEGKRLHKEKSAVLYRGLQRT